MISRSGSCLDFYLTCLFLTRLLLMFIPKQCYLAALENKEAPPAPEKYSKATKAQPPPGPVTSNTDGTAPPPAPTPAPPPGMLVPPVEEPVDDEWGEDEEYENEEQCKVLYDFQGNSFGV